MLPARSPFARLEGFLRDTLGSGATRLHEEWPQDARTVAAAGLGWSDAVTRGFGFPEVFAHQARTYELMRDGKHVIITTPTASGKTGAFFPGVFDRLERDPRATALFVYPLVALGQDQRDKLLAFRERGGFPWEVAAFQGSAQGSAVFRPGGRMVTATPDKLHWSLTQPGVREFLRNLSFLVLDEAHTYRGGFGSEVAGMLRRLLALARALGANPQVILSTATIGNPAEFARELTGVDAVEVSESGAARHGKRFVLADHRGQPRRFWNAVMDASARYDLKVLAFFRGRSRAARLYSTYRAQPQYARRAHLYMAGTSDREGRLSEFRRARSGVMFATNALEAGVDIGDLEVVIIDGYPGSRMAFRQMAGRAGRIAPGLVLYLPALNEQGVPQPADAFYSNAGNFLELLTGPIEKAVVEAHNPYLSPRHAARANDEFTAAGLPAPHEAQPSPRYWNLRGEGSLKFAVVEAAEWERHGVRALDTPLESPSQHYALTEKHEGAVFTLDGQGYKVLRWEEHPAGTAILVEKHDAANLFTRGLYAIEVTPARMGEWERRGPLAFRHGEVVIRRRYTGYQMLRQVFERVCVGCDREPGDARSRAARGGVGCGAVRGQRHHLRAAGRADARAVELGQRDGAGDGPRRALVAGRICAGDQRRAGRHALRLGVDIAASDAVQGPPAGRASAEGELAAGGGHVAGRCPRGDHPGRGAHLAAGAERRDAVPGPRPGHRAGGWRDPGVAGGGGHRLPLALRGKRADQWLVGSAAGRPLRADWVSHQPAAGPALGDARHPLEGLGLLHGDLPRRTAGDSP